jgi:hypothetical protein
MKALHIILTATFALGALCVLIFGAALFITWLGGGFNVVLPGLGLVVSGGLILIALLVIELVLLPTTLLLARRISRKLS